MCESTKKQEAELRLQVAGSDSQVKAEARHQHCQAYESGPWNANELHGFSNSLRHERVDMLGFCLSPAGRITDNDPRI